MENYWTLQKDLNDVLTDLIDKTLDHEKEDKIHRHFFISRTVDDIIRYFKNQTSILVIKTLMMEGLEQTEEKTPWQLLNDCGIHTLYSHRKYDLRDIPCLSEALKITKFEKEWSGATHDADGWLNILLENMGTTAMVEIYCGDGIFIMKKRDLK